MIVKFPIGDWSNDGHGLCDYFCASTEASIDEVRQAHFDCIDVFGFDIGDICSEWGDRNIDPSIETKIRAIFPNFSFDGTPKNLFNLWIDILNHVNPFLFLREVVDKSVPIHHCGFDDKGRHLKTPGYGLF